MSGTLPQTELSAEHRAALVIATGKYKDGQLARLRAPASDAKALAAVLGDPTIGAFNVVVLADQPAQQVRLGVQDFLSERGANELLVVYLSCHGIRDARGRLYFAAADTRKTHLASTGIESDWLIERLGECKARRQVLILDCCYSGAFGTGAKGDGDLDLQRHVVGHGRGRVVLTASREREYSFEGRALPGAGITGSVFTAGLVEGLRTGGADENRDGLVSVEDAYDYAYNYVQASGADQTPQRWAYGAEGRIWLARSPTTAGTSSPDESETATLQADRQPPANPPVSRAVPQPRRKGTWWRRQAATEPLAASSLYAHLRGSGALLRIPSWVLDLDVRDVTKGVTFSLDGSELVTFSGDNVRMWNPRTGQPVTRIPVDDSPHPGWSVEAVKLFPDGTLLAVTNHLGDVKLWDPRAGQPPGELLSKRYSFLSSAVFSPDGTVLATVHRTEVRLWDSRSRRFEGEILTGHSGTDTDTFWPLFAAFSPDGTVLATAGTDGTIRLWDPRTRRALGPPLAGHTGAIASAAFSPDGSLLATGGPDAVRLWDPRTHQPVGKPLDGHNYSVTTVAFSPDGALLATSDRYSVRLWDPYTCKALGRRPLAYVSWASGLAFSPDGQILVTASGNDIRVWDPHARTALGPPLTGHTDTVEATAFSSDGDLLATIGKDRTIRIWEVGRSVAR